MIDPRIQAAGELLASLSGEERQQATAQLKQIVATMAPPESLGKPIPIRNLGEYLDTPIPTPPELVTPYLVVRGGINATIGRSGKGKTVMNLNRNMRWAAGLPWFDALESQLIPTEPLRVLIIENEGAAGLFHKQIGIMLSRGPFNAEQRKLVRENILIWGDGGYSNLKLDDPDNLSEVRRGIEHFKPDVVYIEPFRGLWKGNENDSGEMVVVVQEMQALASEYALGLLVAHHEIKHRLVGEDPMNASRGSGVLENFVATMENFESVKGGVQRELGFSKVRYQDPDRPPPAPLRLEWDRESQFYIYVAPEKGMRELLDKLRAEGEIGSTAGELSEVLEEPVDRVRRLLRDAQKEGLVRKRNSLPGQQGGASWVLVQADDDDTKGGLSL